MKSNAASPSLTVALRSCRFHAFIGVFEQERRVGNDFSVDLTVSYSPAAELAADDISGLISYADMYEEVESVMKEPRQLLESAAYEICMRVRKRWPGIHSVKVEIAKLHPPISGCTGSASVALEL